MTVYAKVTKLTAKCNHIIDRHRFHHRRYTLCKKYNAINWHPRIPFPTRQVVVSNRVNKHRTNTDERNHSMTALLGMPRHQIFGTIRRVQIRGMRGRRGAEKSVCNVTKNFERVRLFDQNSREIP